MPSPVLTNSRSISRNRTLGTSLGRTPEPKRLLRVSFPIRRFIVSNTSMMARWATAGVGFRTNEEKVGLSLSLRKRSASAAFFGAAIAIRSTAIDSRSNIGLKWLPVRTIGVLLLLLRIGYPTLLAVLPRQM